MKMAEGGKQKKRFPCTVCEYSAASSAKLKLHVKGVHEKIKDHACG